MAVCYPAMNTGRDYSGASDHRQLAGELCITIKRALGINKPDTADNGRPRDFTTGRHQPVSPTAVPATAPPTPLYGYNGLNQGGGGGRRSTSVRVCDDVFTFDDDDEISESRASFLKLHPLVDADLFDKALSDCYGRFVALLPEDVLRDHVHLCFYLQEAFWWYSDKWVVRHPDKLPPMRFGSFLSLVCQDCELLRSFITPVERSQLLTSWRDYSRRIPVRGGILINETCDKVLLVQSYQSHHWTFPRGKTDESETDISCASREILEEVGLDVRGHINPQAFLENEIDGRSVKLFIVPGINEHEAVHPKTDYEIKHIKWVPLTFLSDMLSNKTPSFVTFHVRPFVKGLWSFVQEFRSGRLRKLFPKEYEVFVRLSTSSVTGIIPPNMTFHETAILSSPKVGSRRANTPHQPRLFRNKSTGNLRKQIEVCQETFGESSGWSPDEMFRVNREKFGVKSTYTEEGAEKVPGNKHQRELIPFDPESFLS